MGGRGSFEKKLRDMQIFCGDPGTRPPLSRYAVRIVTFCPPALAIHDMGPDALTSPPPGSASGPKFVQLP